MACCLLDDRKGEDKDEDEDEDEDEDDNEDEEEEVGEEGAVHETLLERMRFMMNRCIYFFSSLYFFCWLRNFFRNSFALCVFIVLLR